tara:strand:+ start:5 stop:553 length:549 start_codon:yes stop_codon:yes gene_type:complete
MASELQVTTIRGVPTGANANQIVVPTGQKIVGTDTGSIAAPGSVVQVQDASGSTSVTIANSGSGRIYSDLLTISYTPVSSSNKIVLLGAAGFSSSPSESSRGAFGITFDVNGTNHEFGNYPWYDTSLVYSAYPPDTSISKTVSVPTGSTFNIKLRGFSYNESVGTMTPSFLRYTLTVMEIAQ